MDHHQLGPDFPQFIPTFCLHHHTHSSPLVMASMEAGLAALLDKRDAKGRFRRLKSYDPALGLTDFVSPPPFAIPRPTPSQEEVADGSSLPTTTSHSPLLRFYGNHTSPDCPPRPTYSAPPARASCPVAPQLTLLSKPDFSRSSSRHPPCCSIADGMPTYPSLRLYRKKATG